MILVKIAIAKPQDKQLSCKHFPEVVVDTDAVLNPALTEFFSFCRLFAAHLFCFAELLLHAFSFAQSFFKVLL